MPDPTVATQNPGDPNIARHPLVVERLGEGTELTEEQEHILSILLDPKNAGDFNYTSEGEALLEEMLDDLITYGYEEDIEAAELIAHRLSVHFRQHTEPDMTMNVTFAVNWGNDGMEGYTVNVQPGTDGLTSLGVFHPSSENILSKFPTETATGLRQALAKAEIIHGNYVAALARAKNLATRLSLVRPADAGPAHSAEPQTDHERMCLPDWQSEVAEGMEFGSFRDWYNNRYPERVTG